MSTNSDISKKLINADRKEGISFQIRQIIFQAMHDLDMTADLEFSQIKTEHPSNKNYGDYSSNIAMIVAGRLKMKPFDLAQKISDQINKYIREQQTISGMTDSKIIKDSEVLSYDILEKSEAVLPGFLNLYLSHNYLVTQLSGVLEREQSVKSTQMAHKKIMVEFAHPNTHKEIHIGHLRNIAIGESLVRILEANGAQLFRANYEGDVGLHVAKAIWGVKKQITDNLSTTLRAGSQPASTAPASPNRGEKRGEQLTKLRELNPIEKAKFLGEAYAAGCKAYDEGGEAKEEIITLNKQIYKDPKSVDLWEETRKWSLEYYETVYKRLGTHFDHYFFESEVEAIGRGTVIDSVKKGIFTKDQDGSIFFPGEKIGLNNCVFVTKEGYATYEGKDIAVEEMEYQTFPFDLDIHVVANEQRNFFQIAFAALEAIYPHQKGRQYHLSFGMVNLKGGKLSSRTGNVVTADGLLDNAKEKIKAVVEKSQETAIEKKTDMEIEEITEKVAVAAVKYSMLKVNPKMDIAFDLSESVSFEGDSGPYLLYTYARCKSVLRKSGGKYTFEFVSKLEPEEKDVLRLLARFCEVIEEAGRTLCPNILGNYLFDLAQIYNLFYHKHTILGTRDQGLGTSTVNFRLALTQATSTVIKEGLHLLGIETVEKM